MTVLGLPHYVTQSGNRCRLCSPKPILKLAPRFSDLLDLSSDEKLALDGFESMSTNGRPMGTPAFITRIEKKLGRTLKPQKRGPKSKADRAEV